MPKGVVQKMADDLLSKKTPFEKIAIATGWTIEEIWLYMDMTFRAENDLGDKRYCVWGENEQSVEKVHSLRR